MMNQKEINQVIEELNKRVMNHDKELERLCVLGIWQCAAELDSISYRLKQIAEKK